MSQKPKDAVSPDEIVTFIKNQGVSEEAATGIKLLRRSAETIAWMQSTISNFEDQSRDAEPVKVDQADHNDAVEQIALALGLEDDTLDGVLDKIESLINERNIQIAAIQQRDDVIEQADREIQRLNHDRGLSPVATADQSALIEATKFGYALIGLSYTNGLPDWVVSGAQEIIEYGQNN